MGTMSEKKQSAKATLAAVSKEMAKPRVARSAREHSQSYRNDVLLGEDDIRERTVDLQPTVVINEPNFHAPLNPEGPARRKF